MDNFYDRFQEDESWLDELDARLATQKFRSISNDDNGGHLCAIVGCEEKSTREIWVTIRGKEWFKRFCRSHGSDQAQAEKLYRLGM